MKVLSVRTRGRKDGVGTQRVPTNSTSYAGQHGGDLLHPQRVPISAFWRLRHHEAKSKMKGRDVPPGGF